LLPNEPEPPVSNEPAPPVPDGMEPLMPTKRKPKKPSSPTVCDHCADADLVRRITTYPVHLTGPLEGKQINVGRVALFECQSCGHLMPTPAGQAKVDRTVKIGIRFFLGQLH